MKTLWTFLENKNWTADRKYKAAFLITGLLSAALGGLLWLLIGTWTLRTPDWMICFIGYPVIFTGIFVYLYACGHDFHDADNR